MDRNSFVAYGSYRDAAKKLPFEQRAMFYEAIFDYALDGEYESGLDPIVDGYMDLIMPQIDAAAERHAASIKNGKKGGRPPKNNNQNEQKEKETSGFENKNIKVSEQETSGFENKNLYVDVDVSVDDDVSVDVDGSVDKAKPAEEKTNRKTSPKSSPTKKQIVDHRRPEPFFNDPAVDHAFREYLADRAERKVDNTIRAVNLLINEIKRHDRSLWVQAINNATIAHWNSVYFDSLERKQPKNGNSTSTGSVFLDLLNEQNGG